MYYLEVDTLNTPRTARDQSGTIVWQWYSDAFGSTLPNEDPDGKSILTHINLRFPGQYFDGETGLHYNGTRHYDPALGRYLQSDRIGLAGGVNTYAYVYNNPLKYTDPLGLIAGVDDAIEVAAVAEAAAACAANPACAAAAAEVAAEATAAGEAVAATAAEAGAAVGAACKTLSKQAEKGIRSLLKRISEHEQKLNDFKANPTVRPGMEGLPQEVVEAQQQARINHLETEIQTFKDNIQKLLSGQ